MKEETKFQLKVAAIIFVAAEIGTIISSVVIGVANFALFGSQRHLCQCELCKTIRQQEAFEVVDSVIQERIVININKED